MLSKALGVEAKLQCARESAAPKHRIICARGAKPTADTVIGGPCASSRESSEADFVPSLQLARWSLVSFRSVSLGM